MESINPATGTVIDRYDEHSADKVDARVERATDTYDDWRETDPSERARLLEDVADVLHENEEEYAGLMTREMGKPVAQARSEVRKCAWVCEHYAERGPELLQDEVVGVDPGAEARVVYQPLGPVLAVMPWNFPFWQVFRFAAPNLMAGNVGLLKHASNVPGCALAIEDAFAEAGFPDGAFTTLLVGSDAVDGVIEDDRVRAVTLTGSTPAGRAVAETAGSNLKKTVLELGGSDPFVVLEDAPLELACRKAAQARTLNSGQSCIAAKRFVVHEAVYDDFLEGFTEEMASLTTGDPADEDTDVGPQARQDLAETLHDQVEATVDAGARVELGGELPDGDGAFYPPTVLADVPRDSAANDQELFGPVAPVFRVPDEAAAVALANDTEFGLGASVWTGDPDRGARVARRIDAGCTFVNEFVKSDPRLPFGGVKSSGYGRELGRPGIREFVNRKTLWVQRDVHEEREGPVESSEEGLVE